MSRKSSVLSVAAAVMLVPAAASRAADFNWNVLGGGNQTWQTAANWSPNTGFPNSDLDLANLAVPLTADLNLSVGGTDVAVARLNIGGSAAAVKTEISGTGGKIIFSNNEDPDFDNDNDIDGNDFLIWQLGLGSGTTNDTGDANGDGAVTAADLRSVRDFFAFGGTNATATPPVYVGRPIINSNGAAGTTNIISAPVRSGVQIDPTPTYRAETVEVRGTRSLNLAGGYRVSGDGNILNSYLPAAETLTVGNIVLEEDSETPPTTNRTLTINSSAENVGRVELSGVISGGGGLAFGSTSGAGTVPSTVVISGANTFTGRTLINKVNLVLANNRALGDPTGANLRPGNPSNSAGFNLLSDNDARTIDAQLGLAQYITVRGDNSLTWAGVIGATNSNRGIVNLLPDGKTFTVTGNIYATTGTDTAVRILNFDGTGTTIVTGDVSGQRYDLATRAENTGADTIQSTISKQGSGAVYLNGAATYLGTTTINGGNFHFMTFNENNGTSQIIDNFGAVGIDTGDSVLTNFFFLSRFAPTSTGGIMLRASDAAATVDYTSGELGAVTGAGAKLTLAAPETGLIFTGSITPADATYRLGGGSGTLTLPNAQLTGANKLVATNGGVVQLNGANTYTGTTSILAKYTTSVTAAAVANGPTNNANTNRVYGGTVVAVNNLANGGAPSGIGSSPSAASNLLIQGSTLRYTGAGASSDRLFTVGTGGATLDASGTGAVNFTNTGSLAMDEAEVRDGTNSTNTTITDLPTTEDLVVGMTVTGANIPAGPPLPTITNINSATSITISGTAPSTAGTGPLTFGSVARTLTLTGTSTAANTLRPNIVNGGAATSVAKTGAGTWVLTGANTYTGTTTVSEGTLLVNSVHTGGGAYTVAAGATLGGAGTAGGSVTDNGVISPGATGATGALAVTGGVTFNAGSTALFQIGGTGAGQFDELNMTGSLAAGGTLDVDLTGGFAPAVGNSFDLLDFASASGTFTLSLPTLGAGLAWNTSSLLTTGTISVVAGVGAVPEPATLALAVGALLALTSHRRRRS